MTDIVERLRADNALLQGALGVQTDLVMQREAEIERLRAENEKLAAQLAAAIKAMLR